VLILGSTEYGIVSSTLVAAASWRNLTLPTPEPVVFALILIAVVPRLGSEITAPFFIASYPGITWSVVALISDKLLTANVDCAGFKVAMVFWALRSKESLPSNFIR
jgi:hypothetical protein